MTEQQQQPQQTIDEDFININRTHWNCAKNVREPCPFIGVCRCDIDCPGCGEDEDIYECKCLEYKQADPQWIPFDERNNLQITKRQTILSIIMVNEMSKLYSNDIRDWCYKWAKKQLTSNGISDKELDDILA